MQSMPLTHSHSLEPALHAIAEAAQIAGYVATVDISSSSLSICRRNDAGCPLVVISVDGRQRVTHLAGECLLTYIGVDPTHGRLDHYWRNDTSAAWQWTVRMAGAIPLPLLNVTLDSALLLANVEPDDAADLETCGDLCG